MALVLEVAPHPTGPWLVKAGQMTYAVPERLARHVVGWQGRQPTAAELRDCPAPPDVDSDHWTAFMVLLDGALRGDRAAGRLPSPVWLRVPLVPQRVVQKVAGWLRPLASGWGLLGLASVGLVGYGHLWRNSSTSLIDVTGGEFALAVGIFIITAFWHELGHAAALSLHRYPPGGIGCGLLFVIPVLFADVTAVGVLSRRGRVRVDLAGVVFQFGLGGVFAICRTGGAVGLAANLALVAVVWSLFPFVRADGYWLACDLLGLPELESDPEPRPHWSLWCLLRLYRWTNALFLLMVGFYMPWRYAHLGGLVRDRLGASAMGTMVSVPLLAFGLLALGVVWWNIVRRVYRLVVG